MDFQSEKSFGKLRLRAFQPYYQILCMLKHVKDVEDYLRHLQHALIYTWLLYSIQYIQCYVSQHLQHQTMCIDTY